MPVTKLITPLSPLQETFHSYLPSWLVKNPKEFNFDFESKLSSFPVIAIFLTFYVLTAIGLNRLLNSNKKNTAKKQTSENGTKNGTKKGGEREEEHTTKKS